MSALTSLGQGGSISRQRTAAMSKGDVANNILYPGVDYSLPPGFGAGTAAAINAAMATCAAAGGGEVWLPATDILTDGPIDNKYARVLVRGAGGKAGFHDAGNPTWGTRIVPNFAGIALRHRTPFAAEAGSPQARNDGGGFENIVAIGNGLATRLLEVISVTYGSYDVFLSESVGTEAALFTCGITGTDIAEAADIQAMEKCNIQFRQIAGGQNADGVVFSGSANANVSGNFDVMIKGQHRNGHAFRGRHCDNNHLSVAGLRDSGGTGNLVYLHGGTTSLGGAYANLFTRLAGAGPIFAEGTDTGGVTSGKQNTIQFLDVANGSPTPTSGTGAKWRYETSAFVRQGGGEVALVLGNNGNQVNLGIAELGGESLLVRNGSSNHVLLSNGTERWGINIDSTTGNLRIVRNSGTGHIELMDKAKVDTLLIRDATTSPTPPTGYAALYIDNTDGDLKIKFGDGTVKTIATDT